MAAITTKFSVGDVCYTFDSKLGIIYRSTVYQISVLSKFMGDSEVTYQLTNVTPEPSGNTSRVVVANEYEQNLYLEAEVKELANTWLINKSISIFSDAGL